MSDSRTRDLEAEIRAELAGAAEQAEFELPATLPILPLRGAVLFPTIILPILVGKESTRQLILEAFEGDRMIGVAAMRDPDVENPVRTDVHDVGCLARIVKVLKLPNGNLNVIVQGIARVELGEASAETPYLRATCDRIPIPDSPETVEIEAQVQSAHRLLSRLMEISPNLPNELESLAAGANTAGELVDVIAAHVGFGTSDRQRLLETATPGLRLTLLLELLTHQLQVLELSRKIESDVQGEIDRGQREAYLRERLRAIKRELGEEEDDAEIEALEKRIAKLELPEPARKVARQEMDRLGRMSPAAAEYHVLRSYIDWLLDMPWGTHTSDNLDLRAALEHLDAEHYDLEKVKKRIIEYLAVRRLKPEKRGPILCFIGPPGVGKTSLGRSIANALGREFVRLSLGGVHDEAEIRGHRRTYVGAMPGRILQGLKRAGSMNPVFMLDEIDKVGQDFRGDPSAALLEVLDPEQNDTFSDHYLEIEFDLSRVLFIATANVPEDIPAVLRDRMEILEIPGYTAEDKVEIARRHLVPRQIDDHGLTDAQLSFDDNALTAIVRDYTEEAGVRGLERELATICRAQARRVAEALDDESEIVPAVHVSPAELHDFLGPVKYFTEVAERTAVPGVAVGLAWTATGGDILFIEATRMPGKGNLKLTGQLGDVMKESAEAALSYLRSHADELGIPSKAFREHDLHVHVPAGATPKDGPSAGVTIVSALASLFTGRSVAPDLGMTGELTLRGLVLPVGGVKNKVLAARRAGLRRIALPAKNAKDLEEIPEHVREGIEFHFVERVGDMLELALPGSPPAPRKTSGGSKRRSKTPTRRPEAPAS
ncbi:MAG: endopeptidase La [Acidobacteria bacterium]|nr:endopeptidase La [Acidobacteriota bacterium]